MSDFSVKVDGLSKRYRIGLKDQKRDTLGMSLVDFVSRPVRNLKKLRGLSRFGGDGANAEDIIWALKDVSFEIAAGEVVGVIGANGAGKSTLLKILARITEPTGGQIATRGRVSSLLEVGTGFHPELTGRENVYLNGTVLGMTRKEISSRFDEIVDFSGVERFLDTPVKRYSSGMRVRLAFAVAAHLAPEIMLVDEVLAVGDAAFQQKCLGKMQSVATEGRTVVFVSHNMGVIQRLCSRGIVLVDGEVASDGPVRQAVDLYLSESTPEGKGERTWEEIESAPGDEIVRLLGIRTKDQHGQVRSFFEVQEPIDIEVDYAVLQEGRQISAVIEILNAAGEPLIVAFDDYVEGAWGEQPPAPTGSFRSTCHVPGNLLQEGTTQLNLRIFMPPREPERSASVREIGILSFMVNDSTHRDGARGSYPFDWGGPAVRPKLQWAKQRLPAEALGSGVNGTEKAVKEANRI